MTTEPPDRIREAQAAWEQPQQPAQPQYGIVPAEQQYGVQAAHAPQLARHGAHAAPAVVAPKNPALALILSFFIPGLGTMVSGKVGKGFLILGLYVLGILLTLVLIGWLVMLGVWIWGLVDAHTTAQAWNRAHGVIS